MNMTNLDRVQRRVRADLRSAVWEASQVMSADAIRHLVENVIREVESDRP